MNNRLLTTAPLLAALILTFAGCAGLDGLFEKPEARIASIEVDNLDFESVTLIVNVEIRNPNSLGLTLDAYDYGLDAWDSTIVEGRQESEVSLKAQGVSSLPIPITLDFNDLLAVGSSARSADSIPLDIRLGLEIAIPYMGAVRLDLSGSIEVPIPKAPRIVPARLQVDRITLTGADISLALDMENPNSFGMTIRSLDGSLLVGGREWGTVGLSESVQLNSGARKTAVVKLRVSFGDVGQSAWSLLNGSGNADVSLDGDMDIDLDIPGFNGSGIDWDADARVSIVR